MPNPSLRPSSAFGADLAARFASIRAFTERLAAPLSAEDQTVQSMPDASPTKWHLAHTSWFFETFLLSPQVPGYVAFDPAYAYLFNSYYEAVGPRHPRPQRGLISRPGVEQVLAYRRHVTETLLRHIEALPHDLVELGLQHEQQHQELILMDIKHALSCNPLLPAYRAPAPEAAAPAAPLAWVRFDGGLVETGFDGEGFAFDNEGPRHRVWLEPFALASRPATCGEYADFVADGGYRRPDLWLSAGWATVQERGWDAPLYWRRVEDGWRIFTLSGERDLRRDEPVCHVSFYEAAAFAKWSGKRLPREAEWELAAEGLPLAGNDAGSGLFHPAPAAGGDGVLQQMFGDVWEWTGSPYVAYPGFREPAGAIGEYNGKFMANQMVLRGGCAATPPGHIRSTYRNFFPPDARWPFGGIRLAEDRR